MMRVRAPGRVNLIGEHTDYNDGFVLPVAIDREIHLHAQPRTDHRCLLYSETLDDQIELELEALLDMPPDALPDGWTRYVAGVAVMLMRHTGRTLTGVEGVVSSTLPTGAGLSSSAALEAAFATLWNTLDRLHLDGWTLARLCQQAEHEYAGVHCGMMDQAASLLAQRGHALFLDTRTLQTRHAPLPPQWLIVVADTGKPRTLSGSEYNQRRMECQQAVEGFRAVAGEAIIALRDVSPEVAALYLPLLSEPARRRARHVIGENGRVLAFLDALARADTQAVRHLMLASHASLRDDYEVSCPELDAMVTACLDAPGCVGARLTGAGFGGACVALVERAEIEPFLKQADATYRAQSHYTPQFFVCESVEGATAFTAIPLG
ncbi:MAG: galactokinase [Fimbriimonadales bacterium]|nr:galactokinase [Fimbriimonadales bacterium]